MAEKMMKTVFDWEHFAIYLSGAIDFATDGGKGWRDEWTDKLVEIGIKRTQIYNPCRKPFSGAQFNLDDEAAIARECRQSGDWERFYDIMGQVMHMDLRLLDKSDLILVNMPKIGWDNEIVRETQKYIQIFRENQPLGMAVHELAHNYAESRVPTYGTIHEIVVAHLQRKPIFLVWEENGLAGCSAWLMRLVGYKNIFFDVDSMVRHLSAISQGERSFNANEWLLLDPK
ncbi:MAG: hypothetical protein ACXAC5_01150 [Promethearchaeota archaeon]|jgi:hypothetical protein